MPEYQVDVCAEILASGDGSASKPYKVHTLAEEFMVIQLLGKERVRQELVDRDGKPHDRITCADGSSLWFDVSQTPLWRGSEKNDKRGLSCMAVGIVAILVILAILLLIVVLWRSLVPV